MGTKGIAAVFLSLVLVGLAVAQTITITNASSPKAGQIDVEGSYTLPDKNWVIAGVDVHVRPTKGAMGEGGRDQAVVNQKGQKFTGTVLKLPAGKYDVQVLMRVNDPNSKDRFIYSATTTGKEVK